jgi:hypothetical protein
MDASDFEEEGFFAAIFTSGARALLIGRRAMVALGAPVLTADYDFWIHIDDIERFNAAAAPFGLEPNCSAEGARQRGRYALENDERVDVLVARSTTTVESMTVRFEDVWRRRQSVAYVSGQSLELPSLDDLIATKLIAARAKDLIDIDFLRALRASRSEINP